MAGYPEPVANLTVPRIERNGFLCVETEVAGRMLSLRGYPSQHKDAAYELLEHRLRIAAAHEMGFPTGAYGF